MNIEILTQFKGNEALTRPIRRLSKNSSYCSNPALRSEVSFGPCHSPKAGTGTETLFLRKVRSGVDFPLQMEREKHDVAILRTLETIPGPILVSAAHYVPNAQFPDLAPLKSVDSISESRFIVEKMKELGKSFAFLVIVNDIKIDGEERNSLYHDYTLPSILEDRFSELKDSTRTDFKIIVVSEAKLVERLSRDWKSMRKSKGCSSYGDGSYIAMKSLFGDSGKHTAKCIRGFARLPAVPRELGFSSFVQVMPRCAVFNAHKGYMVGTEIYGEVPSVLLYRTHRCW